MTDQPENTIEPGDFRDSIPTVDRKGKRVWIYPRKPPTGKKASRETVNFYRMRTWVSLFLLAVFFVGPFVRINGNPLLMMNIVERKFSLFGVMFWPQDLYLFALAMITGMVMLVLFTAVFGRIWCGWLCPQTVLMEMVFRRIEYWIEGDAAEQRKLAASDWTAEKFLKKGTKHAIFLALSFVIANYLLAYIIGSERLLQIITDPPSQHAKGLVAMLLFTFLFYKIFASFREQACTFICPYGRFQSVLLDENSIVVAYDHKRGELRGRKRRGETFEQRREQGLGDCVDCNFCVEVCPTGIDIRNGTQMECVNCTACIDACNSVMERIKRPPGLIRFASFNNIEKNEKLRFTPRLAAYTALLLVLCSLLGFLLSGRTEVDAELNRVRGTWYQVQDDGRITNMFHVRLLNKTHAAVEADLRLLDAEGSIQIPGDVLRVAPEATSETGVVISLAPQAIQGRQTKVDVGLFSGNKLLRKRTITFTAPTSAIEPRP